MSNDLICPHCNCSDLFKLFFKEYQRQDEIDNDEYFHVMIYHCDECDKDFTVEETWVLKERKNSKEVL